MAAPRQRDEEPWLHRILLRRPPFFWWTLANILAFCLAVLSWVFFVHIFENPEVPRNYRTLSKLSRAPLPKAFEALHAPKGKTANPQDLYKKFYNLTNGERELLNRQLLKSYLTNYKNSEFTTYIRGNYTVLQSRPLRPGDFISEGVAIQAQALRRPDEFHGPTPFLVVIELILPYASHAARQHIHKGDLLHIGKNPHYLSIVHVEKIEREGDEPIINLTVAPLVYESPFVTSNGKPFDYSPPEKLNVSNLPPLFTK